MKHTRFEGEETGDENENIAAYGGRDRKADKKKRKGIATNFAESLDYGESSRWYQQLPNEASVFEPLSPETTLELRKEAASFLHGETMAYETKMDRKASSDQKWAKTLLSKGAISDRVAAATVLIQDSPIHQLSILKNLVSMVKPAKKKDGIVVIETLTELFPGDLLIPRMKLRKFESHPLGTLDQLSSGNKETRKKILALWYFEDQLREVYASFVDALDKFGHDTVESNKEKAISAMSTLLMMHPEQEKILLKNIVNKLGDPTQKIASKVIYHLCQVLYNHSNMKASVLKEIELMLFRKNISPRAQYYGICFLNQFYLKKDDNKIAEDLIRIYFSFFKACIKRGDIDSRQMAAILTGVKRCYPYADPDKISDAPQHIDAIHKIVHLGGVNTAIHALALLYQISGANKSSADRYYSALYRKLGHPDVYKTTHTALLFSLLYKSLRSDQNIERVTAFIKRIFQLCLYTTVPQTCGLLFLLSQATRPQVKSNCIKLNWKAITEEVAENVNDSALKVNDEESKEDGEKIEEKKTPPKMDLLKGTKFDLLGDSDEEEIYHDVPDEDGDKADIKPKILSSKKPDLKTVSSWYHANIADPDKMNGDEDKPEEVTPVSKEKEKEMKILLKRTANTEKVILQYNPLARNPAFCGAEHSISAELLYLVNHFHPTIQLFARRLLNGQLVQYTGDPLKDFSAARFLDRFAFKNPKQRANKEDENSGELKKVKGSHPKFAIRKNYSAKGIRSLAVNSTAYLNESKERIPVDEQFLYDFLQKRREHKDIGEAEDDSDKDSITSEDFEKYLDDLTTKKAKGPDDDIGGDSDSEKGELEELDYMKEMEEHEKKSKKKAGSKKQEDDEEEWSDDEALDQQDDEDGSDLDFGNDDEDADEEELLLEDSEDNDEEESQTKPPKHKKSGSKDFGSLFASAEEFSTLLEDTASNRRQGTSQAVSNTDNAHPKQLDWEEKRDRWLKGYNKKLGGNSRKFNRKGGGNKFDRKPNSKFDGGRKFGGKRKAANDGSFKGKRNKFH